MGVVGIPPGTEPVEPAVPVGIEAAEADPGSDELEGLEGAEAEEGERGGRRDPEEADAAGEAGAAPAWIVSPMVATQVVRAHWARSDSRPYLAHSRDFNRSISGREIVESGNFRSSQGKRSSRPAPKAFISSTPWTPAADNACSKTIRLWKTDESLRATKSNNAFPALWRLSSMAFS